MSNLHKMTANQLAEIKNDFLKDLSIHGDDVVYTEKKATGGTWDAVKDQMTGGTISDVSVAYRRALLIAPVKLTEETASGKGIGYAFGSNIGEVVVGSTLVARVHTRVPLTQSGVYEFQGMKWKLQRIVESYSIGRKKIWNLVKFVRA